MGPLLDSGPTPFDLRRFQRGPSGFTRCTVAAGFEAGDFLSSGCPSPRSNALQPHPHAHASAPLLGFQFPYSARQPGAPVYPDGLPPHRHHPSSGFLTLSTSCFALDPAGLLRHHFGCRSFRLRSWGSPGFLRLAWTFRSTQGRPTPGFLSKALPVPATSACSRALLSCTSPASCSVPFGGGHAMNGGRFRVSIAETSALLRWRTADAGLPEVSDRPSHSRARNIYSTSGLPRRFPEASPLRSTHFEIFRVPASFEAPRACVTATDPTTNRVVEGRKSRARARLASIFTQRRHPQANSLQGRRPPKFRTALPQSIHRIVNRRGDSLRDDPKRVSRKEPSQSETAIASACRGVFQRQE